MSRLIKISLLALLAGGIQPTASVLALDSREANTSLTVPEIPAQFGFQTVNAFPQLTFVQPVGIISAPGETNRLFVVELGGTVQVITNLASPTKTLFLNISDHVPRIGEGGLLGMAFHPNWQTNGQFFVYYTTNTNLPSGYVFYDRLSRFEIDQNNPNLADPNSEQFLISQLDEHANHNAGDLHFGPDGYLYVSLGDEGQPWGLGYNTRLIDKDFFCAIMRIDVDKRPGSLAPNPHPAIHLDGQNNAFYAIPPDNPFIGATDFNGSSIDQNSVRTEFWAVGFRNPWRISFDPASGIMYCADVGMESYEEVNIITKGGDYGWRYKEGFHDFAGIPPNTVQESDLTPPVLEYPRSGGPVIPGGVGEGASVIGGVVYNGDRLGQLKGYYVFGDYMSGRIFAFRYDASSGQAQDFRQLDSKFPTSFGFDPSNGDVLFTHGTIGRLVYSSTPVQGQPLPTLLSQTGAFSDLAELSTQPGIVPYEINVPFWSDHAIKSRWFSIPDVNDTMTFDTTGNWTFPSGTVWIKHFDLELTNGVAASRRRLETRFIVKNDDGVHGFTYKWNAEETDANLVAEGGEDEVISIYNPDGSLLRDQAWRYPARGECLQCHTPQGGYAAGFNTVQLNALHDFGSGPTNQIEALSNVGYFDAPVSDINTLTALAPLDDESISLEDRTRSYLQANCVSCHQPGAVTQSIWDARISTPIEHAGLINGELGDDKGDPLNKVVVPADLAHSQLLQRILVRGEDQMPPLENQTVRGRFRVECVA